MIVLLQLNFTGFFVQTITGFAGALIVYFFTICNATTRCNWLFIYFYMISTPFHVYKEWKYIDKSLLKKLASSFFGLLIGIIVLSYGQPIILKKVLNLYFTFCFT
jgi:O-antigen ligase